MGRLLRSVYLRCISAVGFAMLVVLASAAPASAAFQSWSNQTPANGATVGSSTTLSINANGTPFFPLLLGSSAELRLDGAPLSPITLVPPAATASGYLILSANLTGLYDGPHVAMARVTDQAGVTYTSTPWTFTVAQAPSVSAPVPASGSTVYVGRPAIGLTATDNSPGQLSAAITVRRGGAAGPVAESFSGSFAQGAVRFTPSADLQSGVVHHVTAVVTDAAGTASAPLTWTFTPVAVAGMSRPVECKSCHFTSGTLHPSAGSCWTCHPASGAGIPQTAEHVEYNEWDDCTGCHSPADHGTATWTSVNASSARCGACHPSLLATPHTAPAVATAHTSAAACAPCHEPSLIDEHADQPSGSTYKYQCDTCHTSSAVPVRTAIAAGDTSCTSCHDISSAHGTINHVSTFTSPGCEDCHDADLVVQHAGDCALCHSSPDPRVTNAITLGTLECGACHDMSAGHDALHEQAPNACSDCHETNLVRQHSGDCAVCHQSGEERVVRAIAASDLSCGACHPTPHYRGSTSGKSYLDWAHATYLAWLNGGDNGGTPHGGYAVNTTKCNVCHSVHRAASDAVVSGVGSDWKLTPAAMSCVACHTPSGSNPVASSLVEWPGVYADGGPHNSFSCLGACHGTVHGANGSQFGSLVQFNLTSRNDAAITAAFDAGNIGTAHGSGSNGGTATYGIVDAATFDTYDGSPVDLGAKRAMATGYTCGASGCHSSSQFSVNRAGYAESRASDPAASSTLDLVRTGHLTNLGDGCAPCHSIPLAPGAPADSTCAACHDAVGKATNSSAFPHANRNITFVEADTTGAAVERFVGDSGTLWMYAGDVTFRDAQGEPAPQPSGVANESRRVVLGASGGDGFIGDITDGTCLKCHGYRYWPVHGMSEGSTSERANRDEVNFSTK